MKRPLYISIIAVLFTITAIAQNHNVKYSSIISSGDTLELNLTGEAESVQWQESTDGTTWTDILGAVSNSFALVPEGDTYYRTLITTTECGETYSDTLFITLADTENDTLNEIGVEMLHNHCYYPLRLIYGKELGYDMYEAGTDLFTYAEQSRNSEMLDYSSFSTSNTQDVLEAVWLELYRGVINCNGIIASIDKTSLGTEVKNKYKAEAYFLRAYYNWLLVETFGEIALITQEEPIDDSKINQGTKEEFYTQILEDLNTAESTIPQSNDWGKVNLAIVKAFKARVYLYNNDYTNASTYALELINSGTYSLMADYDNIWDIKNQQNDEFIFAVDYSEYPDPTASFLSGRYANYWNIFLSKGGSQGHIAFETSYDMMPGMTRDIINGRPFRRFLPTRHLLDLYEHDIDKRFQGSFKTVWYSNDEGSIPDWEENFELEDGATVSVDTSKAGKPRFSLGDTAFVFMPELGSHVRATDASTDYYYDTTSGYNIFIFDDLYKEDGTPIEVLNGRDLFIPCTKKLSDSIRTSVSEICGNRDAMIIRLAEMYLIAAEAEYYKGNTTSAYEYLFTLANARAVSGDGASLLASYGISSGTDITIDFILDERARELVAEQHRWLDLKRTGKLVEQVQANNPDATANIKEYHTLRPIPDQILETGEYLSEGVLQNTGY